MLFCLTNLPPVNSERRKNADDIRQMMELMIMEKMDQNTNRENTLMLHDRKTTNIEDTYDTI